MSSRPIVVQSEHLARDASNWLAERAELRLVPYDQPDFARALADAAGLVIRTYTTVDRALLDRAPKLRVVGRAGTGLDNVDVAECRARGVEVVYTPEANAQAVVEYVLCLLCDALRPRVTLSEAAGRERWKQLRADTIGRWQMSTLTLGVLGMGRVGRRIAEVAGAIGFNVLFNDLLEIPEDARFGARSVTAETLFDRSDVLSVHVDGRASNHRFVNSWLIDRMPGDVVFINTSRGFVVDATALAQFLRAHPGAQAHLDVHDPEPFDHEYPLLGLANAKLYPHLASRTETAMRNMSLVVRDVVAVLSGERPSYPAPAVP